MKELLTNPYVLGLIGTFIGTVGLAMVTKWLNRGKDTFDFASKIRDELRLDIERYQKEVSGYKTEAANLRTEVDNWRTKFFDLERDNAKIINELEEKIWRLTEACRKAGIDISTI